jgi:hypothetical protein
MKLRVWAAGTALAVATTLGGGAILTAVDASNAAAAVPARAPLTSSIGACTAVDPTTEVTTALTNCAVQITSLSLVNGVLQAAGTFTAQSPTGPVSTPFTAPVADPTSCPILSLTLGPLHLNLLGLVVDIPNSIVVNITAVPGPGNLLGNLLCGVAHLLDNTGSGAGLTALLNQITSLLGGL